MDDILSEYGTDPTLEQEGVWSNEFRGGIEMQIRSSQSKEVKAAIDRQNKRNERFYRTRQPVPDAIKQKNEVDLACAIVVDWRQRVTQTVDGAKSEAVLTTIPFGGERVACTDDNKKRVFGDARLWSLRQDVIAQAYSVDKFQAADEDADAGNSPIASASGSASEATPTA